MPARVTIHVTVCLGQVWEKFPLLFLNPSWDLLRDHTVLTRGASYSKEEDLPPHKDVSLATDCGAFAFKEGNSEAFATVNE
jgi:hypothetical protein